MGPLVLLGLELPLEPEGVDAAENDEAGEADTEADGEEPGAGLEEGNRTRHPGRGCRSWLHADPEAGLRSSTQFLRLGR